jgi:hypothetical protein
MYILRPALQVQSMLLSRTGSGLPLRIAFVHTRVGQVTGRL